MSEAKPGSWTSERGEGEKKVYEKSIVHSTGGPEPIRYEWVVTNEVPIRDDGDEIGQFYWVDIKIADSETPSPRREKVREVLKAADNGAATTYMAKGTITSFRRQGESQSLEELKHSLFHK
ncbi:hypothetical protein HY412_00755 [Candidatus Kaiserbacteria bacterium]|nr:hypothetical protein [Candidatus Kaiserbacteria bacterium]